MTKTILVTFCLMSAAHAAAAQSPATRPTAPTPFVFQVPTPAPAPAPFPDVVFAPVAPAPPARPAPQAAPVPPVPPGSAFDIQIDLPSFDIPDLNFADLNFADLDLSLADLDASLADMKFALKQQKGPQPPQPARQPFQFTGQIENLYDQARNMIERDQYERALPVLDRVIDSKGTRADAAMYWKGYSLSKLTRRQEALTVLADLQKQFPNGPWAKDARALEVEVRQASGQSVSSDLVDDDTKLLALRGLMQSEPETALPTIEKLLAGNSSVRVKDRALFVLSQSRAPRAREVIMNVARTGSNPELRLAAVRYIGMRPDPESQKMLADIYASTSDVDMKRAILRSFTSVNARDRLLVVAKNEKSPELRAVAVQQLGAVRGSAELEELYRAESDKDVKQRILQSMIAANATDKLAQIARTEKDPELLRMAIRNLGATQPSGSDRGTARHLRLGRAAGDEEVRDRSDVDAAERAAAPW